MEIFDKITQNCFVRKVKKNIKTTESATMHNIYENGDLININDTISLGRPTHSRIALTPLEAARHCLFVASLDRDGPSPYFILTWDDNDCGIAKKEVLDIAENNAALIACIKKDTSDVNSKEYISAVVSLVNDIKRLSKGKTIIGYTNDIFVANRYLPFNKDAEDGTVIYKGKILIEINDD